MAAIYSVHISKENNEYILEYASERAQSIVYAYLLQHTNRAKQSFAPLHIPVFQPVMTNLVLIERVIKLTKKGLFTYFVYIKLPLTCCSLKTKIGRNIVLLGGKLFMIFHKSVLYYKYAGLCTL